MLSRELLEISVQKLCPELVKWREYVDKDLRIAFIGFGKMGLLHSGILNLLSPGVVRAVVDKSILLRFGVSRLINSIRFYNDIDKMLREIEPDAVYITTPAVSHYGIIRSLIKEGVEHIFVEKPPTVDYNQLQSIISMKMKDQIIMVGFQKRYALTFRHAKILLDNDAIGNIIRVRSYIKSSDILEPTKRFDSIGRGVLLELGVHLIDLLTWYFDIKRVAKAESRSIYTKVDDVFKAELEADKDLKISLEISWSDPGYRAPETYIEIQGSKGVIKVSEDYLKISLDNDTEIALYKPHYYQGVPPVNLSDPEYTIEDIDFIESLYEDREPLTIIEKTSDAMKLVEELYNKIERK
jgi:predicted dehydrogenase